MTSRDCASIFGTSYLMASAFHSAECELTHRSGGPEVTYVCSHLPMSTHHESGVSYQKTQGSEISTIYGADSVY